MINTDIVPSLSRNQVLNIINNNPDDNEFWACVIRNLQFLVNYKNYYTDIILPPTKVVSIYYEHEDNLFFRNIDNELKIDIDFNYQANPSVLIYKDYEDCVKSWNSMINSRIEVLELVKKIRIDTLRSYLL